MASSLCDKNPTLQRSISNCYTDFIIDLSNGNYTDEDMKLVATHVMTHKTCKALVLYHNCITEKGALYLADVLENNTSLQKLNIGYNNIGDKGVEYIVKPLLRANKTLVKLHLQSNAITEEGAGYLAEMLRMNPVMRKLGLDYNNIGDEGVKLLSLALSSNNARNGHTSNSQVYRNLRSNYGSSLKALYLDANNITDEGANYLAEMLKNNRTLTGLALGKNDISDVGAQKLVETLIDYDTSIKNFNIFSNKRITDKSLDVFLEFFDPDRRLKMFKLYDCNFSLDGKEKLRMAAARIQGFKLLLEGDGFDLDHNQRRKFVRNQPDNKKVHENWFIQRRQQYENSNSNTHRLLDSIRSTNKSNGLSVEASHSAPITHTNPQPSTVHVNNGHSDDAASKCAIGIELLTISIDSSATSVLLSSNTVRNTYTSSRNVDNGTSETTV